MLKDVFKFFNELFLYSVKKGVNQYLLSVEVMLVVLVFKNICVLIIG